MGFSPLIRPILPSKCLIPSDAWLLEYRVARAGEAGLAPTARFPIDTGFHKALGASSVPLAAVPSRRLWGPGVMRDVSNENGYDSPSFGSIRRRLRRAHASRANGGVVACPSGIES